MIKDTRISDFEISNKINENISAKQKKTDLPILQISTIAAWNKRII